MGRQRAGGGFVRRGGWRVRNMSGGGARGGKRVAACPARTLGAVVVAPAVARPDLLFLHVHASLRVARNALQVRAEDVAAALRHARHRAVRAPDDKLRRRGERHARAALGADRVDGALAGGERDFAQPRAAGSVRHRAVAREAHVVRRGHLDCSSEERTRDVSIQRMRSSRADHRCVYPLRAPFGSSGRWPSRGSR